MVMHCHRYNHFLHQALYDLDPQWAVVQMESAARALGFRLAKNLENYADWQALTPPQLACAAVSALGLGRIVNLKALPDEGSSIEFGVVGSHFGHQPIMDHGEPKPSCVFIGGLVAGILAYCAGQPISKVQSEELECEAAGAENCIFRIRNGVEAAVMDLPVHDWHAAPSPEPAGPRPHRAAAQILAGFRELPVFPDAAGQIPAFGVFIAYQSAAYYAAISAAYVRHATRDGRIPELAKRARNMLVEAGHVCAFFTLGGIVRSVEWQAFAVPYMADSDDPGEVVTACLALAPALGWGQWTPLHPAGLNVHIGNGYEHTLFCQAGLSSPTSDFARGAISGLLNITSKAGVHRQTGMVVREHVYRETFYCGANWTTVEVVSDFAEGCWFESRFKLPTSV
jgi:hypothetical protein